jgi:hypothetical protein
MNLVGDEAGIAALQDMKTANKEYLKFLIQEARTVFERRVDFKTKDGVSFRLSWDEKEQKFTVARN